MTKHGKKKGGWQKKTLRLKDNHTWNAPKGYKVFVLDRGAVSFNIPGEWIVAKLDQPIEIHDAEPPNDNTRLSISVFQLPPGIDWSGLPLPKLLEQSTQETSQDVLEKSEMIIPQRDDLELVWTEHRFLDSENDNREAFSRIALARGFNLHVLITMDFWADDTQRIHPVWDEVLRSLQMGRRIDDPTKGMTLH